MGETSREGLRREMQEELQEDVHVGRLLWVAESFFSEIEGKSYHELGLYYVMDFAPESPVYQAKEPFFRLEGQTSITFRWVSLMELEQITFKPSFLVQGLQNMPEQTVHVLDTRQK